MRLTAQRRVVAEVLTGEHVHLTADQVHQRAAERLAEISRATVYNTLNEFVTRGEISEVSAGGRARRYDPNAHAHQHLLCDRCGLLLDVDPRGDLRGHLDVTRRRGFRITGVEALYHGVCPDCEEAPDIAQLSGAGYSAAALVAELLDDLWSAGLSRLV